MGTPITLTQRLSVADAELLTVNEQLDLTAEERTRSRHRFVTRLGTPVHLNLPRGTVLQDGDVLKSDCYCVYVAAKPEPVLTVTSHHAIDLLRAAYHLGNRHVALEVAATYLRLSPDPVLRSMLEQLGLHVKEEIAPFSPEVGAYRHESHSHG
ncbi:MAG: urease accessory protein UreE [Microcoleus sp. SIO2G3]|nr:urease accessory protein UreE [Microcoleus sp. SIO2G3]